LSVLVVLISAETFGGPLAALFAGVGAAVHPVLVNAASQLYNENIYFCLLFLCIWVYMRWLRTPSLGLALACGCCAGVTALVRESILVPFAALILWTVVSAWHKNRLAASGSAIAMAIGLTAIVMPWDDSKLPDKRRVGADLDGLLVFGGRREQLLRGRGGMGHAFLWR